LVVVQISLSVILLSSAGLLLRSFWNLQRQNLGMQTRSILTINIPLASQQYNTGQKCMDFFLKVESALRRLPGITTVGLSDSLPPAGWTTAIRYSEMSVAGKPRPPAGSGGTVVSRWVTPDYFRALEIPILQGRGFTEAERTSPDHPIIISRLLAERMFPGENPIGQSIAFKPNDPLYTVVGVAANVKNGGLAGQENPEYYQLRANVAGDWSLHSVIVVKTSLPSAAVIPWVRSQISLIDPTAPVEIETLTQRVSILADGPRFTASLLGFFAFTGLLLATIGLYGVTSFVVTQRTQEIGIRMALGAQRGRILRMVMQDAGRLIGLGLFLGLAVSLAGARMMQALLFKIAPRDPVTLGAICGVMLLAGLFAAWWPARRAASIDPMQALRAE
jgi:predicted permease